MKKVFGSLILSTLMLSSCQTALEQEKMYRADYYNYSCPQLYQKYTNIKRMYEEERTSRLAANATSAMAEFLEPTNPRYRNNHPSHREYDFEIEMKAIENLAIDKRCEGVNF